MNGHLAGPSMMAAIKYWIKLNSRTQPLNIAGAHCFGRNAVQFSNETKSGVIGSYSLLSCSLNGCSLIAFCCLQINPVKLSFLPVFFECVEMKKTFVVCLLSTPFRMGMATLMSRSWMPCYETFTRRTRRWDRGFGKGLKPFVQQCICGLACDFWHLIPFLLPSAVCSLHTNDNCMTCDE